MNRYIRRALVASAAASGVLALAPSVEASSHREAPFITTMPRVDGTDFYMFRSYEAGRDGYVTLIANYLPLQDAYGGPNYFDLEADALYEIHIDNDGDAREDLTFRFDFTDVIADLAVDAGGKKVAVPLKNIGKIGPALGATGALNVRQTYTVDVIRSDRERGDPARSQRIESTSGDKVFRKPADNIGTKSLPDYETYAKNHIYDISIPECGAGRLFVGQRREGFAVNLGQVFDLVNLNPLGPPDAIPSIIADDNITSLALEVPVSCLTYGSEPVIGGWMTASVPQTRVLNPVPFFDQRKPVALYGKTMAQVSRLSMPLVNEVVIGLKDKDKFNASHPRNDAQFLTYVQNPTLPELLEILFPGVAVAPNMFPRTDLEAAFLTGIDGLNKPQNVRKAEMMRLNTSVKPKAADAQSNLGALGGDTSGFPNGRRPGDDVVDIELRVAMGALLDIAVAPNKNAPLTDGSPVSAADFDQAFPYLRTPRAGSEL
jgi:hypothetical protein